MGRKLGLAVGLLLMALATPAMAQKIAGLDGDWNGALVTPNGTLHLHLHVESTATATTATTYSVDQGNAAIPTTITRKGDTVSLDMSMVQAAFTGTLKDTTLTGTFMQGGGSLPLTFDRQAPAKAAKKP